jgi:uncharacterized protein YigA (DUF484 family)
VDAAAVVKSQWAAIRVVVGSLNVKHPRARQKITLLQRLMKRLRRANPPLRAMIARFGKNAHRMQRVAIIRKMTALRQKDWVIICRAF